jgi:acyl carrier protein phosphodiesterase
VNWLSHLFLSDSHPACRIGNLLPDLVKPPALVALPADYQRGIQLHRRIDTYTDRHPIVRRSILRLGPEFRRLGGILTDMFYDHFLTRQWSAFSPQSLASFTAEVYQSFETYRMEIPKQAHPPLDSMISYDWLRTYGEIESLTHTLACMSQRFRRPVDLAAAIPVFTKEYAGFSDDFAEFFPELQRHVRLAC